MTALEREIIRHKCESDFLFFFRYFFKKRNGYKAVINSHHIKIAEALQKVYNGEITRLIINIAPRYGKTELAVINFIAWCIAKAPHSKFIHLSYSDTLALDSSMKIKDIISSDEFQELWQIEPKKDAKSIKKWYTAQGGGLYATSSGGQVTGFGAGSNQEGFGGAIIIDDPVKPEDANSDIIRTKINERIPNTIKSRTNSRNTPIIVIMQRLHENDLTGYLLSEDTEKWEHLKIPVLNENEEPLWEFKHTKQELLAMKAFNSYVFAGQYMQEPAPIGGGIIKTAWWRYYKELPPKFDRLIQTLDTAQKTKELNDYSVIATWGKYENKLYLVNITRGKWEMPDLERMAIAEYNKWKPSFVLIEDKSSGTALIQNLRRSYSMPISAIQVNTDKVTRVQEIVGFIESGYCYLPENAEYLTDFLHEHNTFPNGKHDDIVDTTSMAIKYLLGFANDSFGMLDFYKEKHQQNNTA